MYEVVGDPYTTYLDPSSSDSLDNSLNGKYEGVGIAIRQNEEGYIVIKEVYDDSPAMKAGLLEGDIIFKVDDEDKLSLKSTISDSIP